MPYRHYQLVLSWYLQQPESDQLSLQQGFYSLSLLERTGRIDRTQGHLGLIKTDCSWWWVGFQKTFEVFIWFTLLIFIYGQLDTLHTVHLLEIRWMINIVYLFHFLRGCQKSEIIFMQNINMFCFKLSRKYFDKKSVDCPKHNPISQFALKKWHKTWWSSWRAGCSSCPSSPSEVPHPQPQSKGKGGGRTCPEWSLI